MYCVRCGVELQNGAAACPLCGTPVLLEDQQPPEAAPYPRYPGGGENMHRTAYMLVVTIIFLLPILICVLIDLALHQAVGWSGYVLGGVVVLYAAFGLPGWFRRPNPVIFFPAAAAASLLFVLHICLSNGGHWFLSFAFPVGGALTLLTEAVIVLLRYLPRRSGTAFLVLGAAMILLGGLMLLMEFLIHISFDVSMYWWSLIPLAAMALIGALLLVIGLSGRVREALHKRFFL